ncbi:hypothetical protein ACN47E_004669 [Coniothyrium glycines]
MTIPSLLVKFLVVSQVILTLIILSGLYQRGPCYSSSIGAHFRHASNQIIPDHIAGVSAPSSFLDSWWPSSWNKHHKTILKAQDDATESSEGSRTSSPMQYDTQELLGLNKSFFSYGMTKCLPPFTQGMLQDAIDRYVSCAQYAPFDISENRRIAFASISTGTSNEAYDRAIQSQMFHSAVHESTVHVLCEELSEGAWNKIVFLLKLVVDELLKPEDERLEWIMWADRDAIVLDPCRPVSAFIPPNTSSFENISLIINEDVNGFNAGVFIFRVDQWALTFFNAVLAYRYFRPEDHLTFFEQTAMAVIMREPKFVHRVALVPWYWFNAYPVEGGSTEDYERGEAAPEYFRARQGDFIAHFAGHTNRLEEMPRWHDMLHEVGNVWANDNSKRDITREILEYWSNWDPTRQNLSDIPEISLSEF